MSLMNFKIVADDDRNAFYPELVADHLSTLMQIENVLYKAAELHHPSYVGGHWDFIEFDNGAKAAVLNVNPDDDKIKPNPLQNYYRGEMSEFALCVALSMFTCSLLSCWCGEQGYNTAGKALSDNYHLLRGAIFHGDEHGNDVGKPFPDALEINAFLD